MPADKRKSPIAENGRLIQIYLFIILDLTYNATIAKTVNRILEVQYGLDDIIHQALTVHIFVADIEPHTSPRQGNHNLGAILLAANLGLEPRLLNSSGMIAQAVVALIWETRRCCIYRC